MVISVSCPTAEITGIFESYILLATISSLKAHNSSKDPPPLPTIRISISGKLFASLILSDISLGASGP